MSPFPSVTSVTSVFDTELTVPSVVGGVLSLVAMVVELLVATETELAFVADDSDAFLQLVGVVWEEICEDEDLLSVVEEEEE